LADAEATSKRDLEALSSIKEASKGLIEKAACRREAALAQITKLETVLFAASEHAKKAWGQLEESRRDALQELTDSRAAHEAREQSALRREQAALDLVARLTEPVAMPECDSPASGALSPVSSPSQASVPGGDSMGKRSSIRVPALPGFKTLREHIEKKVRSSRSGSDFASETPPITPPSPSKQSVATLTPVTPITEDDDAQTPPSQRPGRRKAGGSSLMGPRLLMGARLPSSAAAPRRYSVRGLKSVAEKFARKYNRNDGESSSSEPSEKPLTPVRTSSLVRDLEVESLDGQEEHNEEDEEKLEQEQRRGSAFLPGRPNGQDLVWRVEHNKTPSLGHDARVSDLWGAGRGCMDPLFILRFSLVGN
jgi:hypothetical protein